MFLRKLEVIRKPKQSPEHETSKISYYGNIIEEATIFPYYGLWLKLFWVKLLDYRNGSQIREASSDIFLNVWENRWEYPRTQ